MTINIMHYLPPIIGKMPEYQNLAAADDAELDKLWTVMDDTIQNQFIKTADENGIERLEILLHIQADSKDSLELRRKRVLLRWTSAVPYTINALRKRLSEIVGEDYRIDEKRLKDYFLGIDILNHGDDICRMIDELLKEWVPANLIVKLRSVSRKERNKTIYAGICGVQTVRYEIHPITMDKTTICQTDVRLGESMTVYQKLEIR